MEIKAFAFVLCAILLGISTAQAQREGTVSPPYCASDQLHQLLLETDSAYMAHHIITERRIFEWAKTKKAGFNASERMEAMPLYTLPVVVHLIVPPGTPVGQGNNLTDEAVEAGLALLNQSFANQGAFQTPNGVDVGIQFCMARRDPQGQPTNGITRHESTLVAETTPCSPFGTNAANDAALKQLVNWDCSQYINIWLVTDLFNANFGCGLAGYAYFPGAPCNIDGIVQESRYWTTASGTQITAHEMGHYLNLFHTFQGGCSNGNCLVDGDRVCDTPPDGSASFAPCNTNSCNADSPDLPDDNTNYMDYTSCLPLHFTEGQRLRMVAGLETGRASLLTSSACQPVAPWDVAISIQNDPTCPTKLCPLIRLKNNGLNTINTLQVRWKINNGPDQLYNWTGTLVPDAAIQVALPCQTVAAGQYALSATADAPNGNPDGYPANNTNTLSGITIASLSAAFEVMTGTNGFTKIFVNNSTGASTYLWDFGDGTTSTQANPTHTYATVGSYNVSLTAANGCGDKQIFVQTIAVTNCIPGWRGLVQGLNNYQEPDEAICDMVKNGVLHIAPSLSKIQYYWTSFGFCDTICVGNNFSVQVRLRNTLGDGGINAYDTSIDIKGEDQSAGVTLMGGAWAQVYTSIWAGNTRLTNRPELVLDLSNWKTVELKLVNDTVYYQYEGANFFKMPFSGRVCNIRQINFGFKGSGMVDWLKVLDSNGSTVYEENFNNCQALAEPLNCTTAPLTAEVKTNFDCTKTTAIVTPAGSKAPYSFRLTPNPTGTTSQTGIFEQLPPGKYRVAVRTACPTAETSVEFTVPEPFRDTLLFQQAVRCNASGRIGLSALGGTPPYSFRLDNGNWQTSGTFENLTAGTYTITARDAQGCLQQRQITLANLAAPLQLAVDSLHGVLDCRDTSDRGSLSVRAIGNVPSYFFSINGAPVQPNGIFAKLGPGNYTVVAYDEGGCSSEPFSFSVRKQQGANTMQTRTLCAGETVQVGTNTYAATGIYRDTLQNTFGCDSVVTTNLTIRPKAIFAQTRTLCAGKTVQVGTNTYAATGIYRDTLQNTFGCDSVVTTNLTIRPKAIFAQTRTLCAGETVQVGTNTYAATGIYRDTLQNAFGCDSVVTTNLTIRPKAIFAQTRTLCAGETVQVGTKTYAATGIYRDTLQNAFGCDSVVTTNLTIRPKAIFAQTRTLCAGETIQVGTKTYAATGIYRDTLQNAFGCDSVVTTNLTIRPKAIFAQTRTLCAGETVQVGTNTYAATGIYRDTLQNTFGCDSVVTTNLTIRPKAIFAQTRTLCAGETVQVGTNTYAATGIYRDTLQNAFGCDSVVTTNLTIRPKAIFAQTRTLCADETVQVGTKTYAATGIYRDTLQNTFGCDSIVTTNLTVRPKAIFAQTRTLCAGETVQVGTKTYAATGIYRDTLQNTFGCDSVVTTNLTIRPKAIFAQTRTLCAGETVQVGTKTYAATGIYRDTLHNTFGCDSVVTTTLTIRPKAIFAQTRTLCAGQTVLVGTKTYAATGIYRDTLQNTFGCDSIVTTNLTVRPKAIFAQTRTLCAGETVQVGTKTYAATGIYRDTLQNAFGCDSIVTTNLTVRPKAIFAQTRTLCAGETVQVGTNTYATTGIYRDTLQNAFGCDSLVTTKLTILSHSSAIQYATICAGEVFNVEGKNYNRTGTYRDTLFNTVGCDSLLTTHLTVLDTVLVRQTAYLCEGDSFRLGTQTFLKPGTYLLKAKTQFGCDSTHLLLLKKAPIQQCDSLYCRFYAPTVFAPDRGGPNAWFEIASPVTQITTLAIYDRWGDMVYRHTGTGLPRWDGLAPSGRPAPAGVYVYWLRGVCANGQVFQQQGEVTLLR